MNKTKELVAAGYALAKELHCAESAALVRELATQLDLQRVRADTLAADNENALAVLKEANQTVLRAKASFEDTEAKNAALVAELSAVETIYDAAVLITSEHYEQCPPEVQKMIRSLAVLQIPAYTAFLAEVRAQGVEELASLAGNECKRYKSVNDRAGVRKWKSIVILCSDFAAQLRKGAAL